MFVDDDDDNLIQAHFLLGRPLVCCFLPFFPFRIYFVLAFAVGIPTMWATLFVCVYFCVHFCVGTFAILMNHIILPCARFTCLSCSANGVWQAKRANISNQSDNIQTTWDRWWSARWVYANGVRHRCHWLTIDSILLHGALLKFMRKIFIFFFSFVCFLFFSFIFILFHVNVWIEYFSLSFFFIILSHYKIFKKCLQCYAFRWIFSFIQHFTHCFNLNFGR